MRRFVSRLRTAAAVLLGLAACALLALAAGLPGWQSQTASQATTQPSRGDRPDEALRFRRLQLQDENGRVPVDGLQRARVHMDAMLEAQQAKAEAAGKNAHEMEVAALDPTSWAKLGPGNVGGRIRALVIDPANANKMFVGSVGGGIWRTDNAGALWSPVNDFMANLAVSTMAINPANSSLMYAGTGEGFGNIDALQGAGIFRSTNGGGTWNQLLSTDPAAVPLAGCGSVGAVPCPSTWLFVNRVAVSPDGSTLLAATQDSAGGAERGIQQSTDGGENWTTRLSAGVRDIRFNPTDSSWAVAGGQGNAHYSSDGGRCWDGRVWNGSACTGALQNVIFNPPIANGGTSATDARVELAYAASASTPAAMAVVYAAVNRNNGELYRSANGGRSYDQVNTGTNFFLDPDPSATNQGWYDNAIWVNPQDPTFVVVGGIDLWRSTDSGQNFTKISAWRSAPASSAHADHHMIASAPGFDNSANRTVFFANDGGVYRAGDIATVTTTSGWTNLNNSLAITQFYGAAGNVHGVIVGGAQDNGNVKYSGNANAWAAIPGMGGDGGYVAADPTDPSYFYGEYIYLQIRRSIDAGVSGTDISAGITEANSAGSNFVAPFILDPNEPNRLLGGGLRLWRTNNAKVLAPATPTWTPITQIIAGGPAPRDIAISAIAVARRNSDFVVVGHNNGRIFLATDATAAVPTFLPIDNLTPSRMVTRLAVDETKTPPWIYATFGGFSADNVYRTEDLGATWTDITGSGVTGLPDVPVRTLVINPIRPSLLYVGTEVGLFASEDAGATWQLPQAGPANVSVEELFWVKGDLVAATHGRGIAKTVTPVYAQPLCAPPDGCACFGLWNCPCTWTNNEVPGSTSDVGLFCPVTMNISPTVRNLAVRDRLTMRGHLYVTQDLSNFGTIVSDVGLAGIEINAGTLSNYRGLNAPLTEGLIAISGPLSVGGGVRNGGTISVGAHLNCGDLSTAAGTTITMTTLSARGNLSNFGAIEGTTLDLNGAVPAGEMHTLGGSGTWTFATGSLGGSSPRSLTLTSNVSFAIGEFGVGQFATLDLAAKTLFFSGDKFTSGNGTLPGNGRIVFSPTDGTSEFGISGPNVFTAGITVASGTVKLGGGGTINGPFVVDPGAIATMPSTNITFGKDVTIHGVIKGLPAAAGVIRFNGTTFLNNGAVGPDLSFVTFNSNLVALSQTISGPGSWGAGVMQLRGTAPGSIALANDVTLAVNEVQVANLNVDDHTLTLLGSRLSGGPINGAGLVVVQPTGGTALVGNSFGGAMSMAPSLKIEAGVATTLGLTIGGYLSIAPGATLSLTAPQLFRVAANLVNNGTINAASGNPGITFEGSIFSNAGTVAAGVGVTFLPAAGSPPEQNLGGAGTWAGTIGIAGNSVTTLLTNVAYQGSNLSVTGRLNTGAFILSLPCTTTWNGTGEAIGTIRRTNLAACVGAAIAYGNPFTTIAFNSGTPPDELTLAVALSPPNGFASALQRAYQITPLGGSGYSATLRLHYLDAELNGNAEATLQLFRKDGATWTPQGATNRSTSNNWVEFANVTQFSPWALASVPAPPSPTTFENWQEGFFTPQELADPAISGDFADPNRNGFNNLLEYAFGLDPKSTNASPQPFGASDLSYFSLTYIKALAPIDLTFTIEQSFDLLQWSAVVPTNLIIADDGVTQTVKAQVPRAGADNMSLRLRVSR